MFEFSLLSQLHDMCGWGLDSSRPMRAKHQATLVTRRSISKVRETKRAQVGDTPGSSAAS